MPKAGSSSRQFVLVIENVGMSLQFSGMWQRPAMLELRPNIVAINPAPTNFAANEIGFVGTLEFRGSAHGNHPQFCVTQASFSPMNGALTPKPPGKRRMTVWAGISQAVLLFEQTISARLFQSGGLPCIDPP